MEVTAAEALEVGVEYELVNEEGDPQGQEVGVFTRHSSYYYQSHE